MHLQITFVMDGTGVNYDPNEPIHLDALLAWSAAPKQGIRGLSRGSDDVSIVDLPLARTHYGSVWCWRASALFPDGPQSEDVQFWRQRFRSGRAPGITRGSPNLTNGPYREWNMPMPMVVAARFVAFADGSRREVRRLLRDVKYLGKKRAHGHGKIIRIDVDECEHDWSHVRDGRATRWLPIGGDRMVRPAPPYWHSQGRVACCEVGDDVDPR